MIMLLEFLAGVGLRRCVRHCLQRPGSRMLANPSVVTKRLFDRVEVNARLHIYLLGSDISMAFITI